MAKIRMMEKRWYTRCPKNVGFNRTFFRINFSVRNSHFPFLRKFLLRDFVNELLTKKTLANHENALFELFKNCKNFSNE